MARLIGYKHGYLRIICDNADDLLALAHQAGLKIATECHCGQCQMGSGRHGFADGNELLHQVKQAKRHAELRPPHRCGGLYLVSEFGDFAVSDDSMLAAVCTPFLEAQHVKFVVGLNYNAGSGRDIPAVAHSLAGMIQ